MSSSTKGMLALLRDLMAHRPRVPSGPASDHAPRPHVPRPGWTTTTSFDLATASGEAHWSTATGSPLLGEQLPALRAELDRRQD